MNYVDGFVLPLKSDKLDTYKKMAENAGNIWMEYGALAYRECVLEDATAQDMCVNFPTAFKPQADETIVFAYIEFKSREHRDEVNAKVMADSRISEGCDPSNMPFDCKRMAYSGFKTLVVK